MFKEVKRNAERQERLFEQVKGTLIEDYYPELDYDAAPFACTIGSNLIPDLMTGRRILVDLDNLPSEEHLIQQLGVDKSFLLKLRHKGLVVIATNLDPVQHEQNVWMHDILADEETIFKSKRTPFFFRAKFPEIEDVQRGYREYLEERFEKLSDTQYRSLISRMDVVPENAPRAGAANKLAWDIARVQAMTNEIPDASPIDSPDEVLSDPERSMDLIYTYKMLAVSPHSGSLGGEMLVPEKLMKRLFPETPQSELLINDNVLFDKIMSYLSHVNLNVEPADLVAPMYWHMIDSFKRAQLLEILEDDSERSASAKVEIDLRLRIAKGEGCIDEIQDFIEKDIARVRKWEPWCSYGYTALYGWFVTIAADYAQVLGPGCALAGEGLRGPAKSLLESVVPRIRVANYVRLRKTR